MKPPRSILDSRFDYVPAAQTDIRKTLDRERKRLKEVENKPVVKWFEAVPIRKAKP